VHPSILPKYRGVKPLENAIANGEKVTGITIHEITQGIDEGDIILQYAKIPIKCFDTYSVLYERQCHAIKNILTRFFKKPKYFIRHKVEQNHSLATYAPRINFQIADEDTAQEIRQTALQNTF
jgi:methionyl-tRNA formyltransferase